MNEFNAIEVKNKCVEWIRNFFEKNGKGCNAVVGISGGKDSSIVAALCVEALGKDKVIGVLMPNGEQTDLDVAIELVNYLGIKAYIHNICRNIECTYSEMHDSVCLNGATPISEQAKINLPPRERLKVLRGYAQSLNGRVANTCNLSEDYIGYATVDGDNRGDFSPLSNLTVTELKQIGYLILTKKFVDKIPSDGLCGKTDEDNLGFTYDVLDRYIRTGEIEDKEVKKRIDTMHEKNLFKLQLMPSFKP